MKPLFILIPFLLFALSAMGQQTEYPDSVFTNKVNGKLIKTIKHYWENGSIKGEETYVNRKLNGMMRNYYYSGVLEDEAPWVNGKWEGLEKTYYESGKLESEIPTKNGKETGMEKIYYESGKLEIEYPYTDDVINGISNVYNESGELESKVTYKNDKIIAIKYYNKSGEEVMAKTKAPLKLDTMINGVWLDSANNYWRIFDNSVSTNTSIINGVWYYSADNNLHVKDNFAYTNSVWTRCFISLENPLNEKETGTFWFGFNYTNIGEYTWHYLGGVSVNHTYLKFHVIKSDPNGTRSETFVFKRRR